MNWICAFTIGLVFPNLQQSLGINSMFFAFAGFCLLGGVYYIVVMKETFGKEKAEIQQMFYNTGENEDYVVLSKDKGTTFSDQ